MPDISIGRLRGGFCVYWSDPQGSRVRHQLKARTRVAAEAEAIDVYRAAHFLQSQAGNTVAQIWEQYCVDLGDKPTAKTMRYTGKAVLAHFGVYRPDQITTELCRSYARSRMAAGISQGTVHTELGHLRSTMTWGERNRLIEQAPYIERPAKPMPKERFLTKPEIARLIAAAEAPHIALAIHLLFGTAARVGAVLDLTWDRVDLDRGTINLRLDDAKTRKGRAIVPINQSLRKELEHAQDAALSDHVIEWGSKRVKSIRKGFDNTVKRAHLKDVSLHTIRHSAAVAMVADGIPIMQVAQYLGHSNTSITFSTYGRFAPNHLMEASRALELKLRR